MCGWWLACGRGGADAQRTTYDMTVVVLLFRVESADDGAKESDEREELLLYPAAFVLSFDAFSLTTA